MPSDPHAFVPLKPRVYLMLVLLAERPRHGYDLLNDLEIRSNGAMRMNAGSFYRLVHRLLDDGLVRRVELPDDEESGGAERKSYELTDLGRATLREEVARQESILELARRWAR